MKLTQIHLKRLTNLARIMREAQVVEKLLERLRRFDMSRWGYHIRLYKGETCSTPACLLGHYANRRDVQRCFLLLKDGSVKTQGKGMRAKGRTIDNAAKHFGITYDQSMAMFGGGDDPGDNKAKTPAGAAQYVERFIKRIQKNA